MSTASTFCHLFGFFFFLLGCLHNSSGLRAVVLACEDKNCFSLSWSVPCVVTLGLGAALLFTRAVRDVIWIGICSAWVGCVSLLHRILCLCVGLHPPWICCTSQRLHEARFVFASRFGLRPLASRLGVRPLASRLGLWPFASRLGLRPLASRLSLWPLASRLGLRPLALRLGLWPLASRLGLRPLVCLWQLKTGKSFLASFLSAIDWVNVIDDGEGCF